MSRVVDPQGLIVVISGPSGVGKGTVHARLRDHFPASHPAVSATTRPPRAGEVDGVDYHFVDDDRFDELIATDQLLEHASYAGNRYGTPRAEVEPYIESGGVVILDVDVQGALTISRGTTPALLVFLEPPSMEELERRLRTRGTEDAETVRRRLDWAVSEVAQRDRFDLVVVNDDLDRCVEQITGAVSAARR